MQTTLNQRDTDPFWDWVAPRYARKPISDLSAYEDKLARVRGLLRPTDRVLEIGCGTGGTALKLAPGVAEMTATDVSRRMIEFAHARQGGETATNVRFRQGAADDMVPGYPFDAICAFSLLHLVDDIPQVLASVRQQLKPGGLFISKTVCLKDGSFAVRMFVRVLTAIGLAPRVTAVSRDGLIRHLKGAGFEIESVTNFGRQHTNPFIVARRPHV